MRWLKRTIICVAAAYASLVCANVTLAQEMSPGYAFAEVKDETDQPVFGAAVVVYKETGEEVGSSSTNAQGRAALFRKTRSEQRFIVRVLKSGYLTYEGVLDSSRENWWRDDEIKIKLVSLSKPKSRTGSAGRASSPLKRMPARAGPSPPSDSYIRDADRRVSASRVLRGHPT